jgi:hypothetical protein
MTTADEYLQYAEECLRWARDAKTDEERVPFVEMAAAWRLAAAKLQMMDGEVVVPAAIVQPARDDKMSDE